MKLSQETMRFLEVFSGVNNHLTVMPGNVLRTASPSTNVFIEANVSENFPVGFGIYDLRKLLGVMKMLPKDFDIHFKEHNLELVGTNGVRFVYFYSSTNLLTQVPDGIRMPPSQFEFVLPSTQLHALSKASGALQVEDLVITAKNGAIQATVTDKMDSASHSSSIDIDQVSLCVSQCQANLKMKNLRLPEDEYVVRISNAGGVLYQQGSDTSLLRDVRNRQCVGDEVNESSHSAPKRKLQVHSTDLLSVCTRGVQGSKVSHEHHDLYILFEHQTISTSCIEVVAIYQFYGRN